MLSKAYKIDFGPWTNEEMKDLLRRVVEEMRNEDVVEILKEQDILDEDGNLN